ncbi:hypothetical protein NLX83_39620 [Allokutzneria sp. A3M-2-11 16]|uniref:hypothetical protein n=1 Tax=Allokutzneria sp. A3M-2-11 16 TaxID=2962043 RepID=UPI0020B6FF42|nr:hypothetical protein [Allokutzneria sp. A3M-2-11 16]MCP3805394.1 hypothetical protein [Allokutzneria sp. A3M-2-11 16]
MLRPAIDVKAFAATMCAAFADMAAAVAASQRAAAATLRPLLTSLAARRRVQLRDGRRVHPSHVRPSRLAIDGRAYHRRRRTRRNTR